MADTVAFQDDMVLKGVIDIGIDYRPRIATHKGYALFGATSNDADAMRAVGMEISGTLDDLLATVDVVVDCTPKHIAAENVECYRRAGLKFILHGGEKHEITGHSFVAEANYASAIDRNSTRVANVIDRVPQLG